MATKAARPELEPSQRPVRRPRRPQASSRPSTARPTGDRRDGRPLLFRWGGHLSKAEKERAKERLALLALSGVVALVAALIGGSVLMEYVVRGLQPVAKVDGKTVARLRDYAAVYGYRQNNLLLQYQSVSDLAQQPAASGDSSLASLVLQQQQLIQRQLSALDTLVVEDFIDAALIRQEAGKRGLVAMPEEVTAELKRQIGYVDPGAAEGGASPTAAGEQAAAESSSPAPAQTAAPAATPTPGRTGRRSDQGFESQLKRYLRTVGGSVAVARSEAEVSVLRQKLQTALAEQVPAAAEQVHARHILVPDETAAKAVQERLRNGESFEALAAELSTDTGSKENGGDLGWFPRGVMVKEFEDAAFKLAPGQTSEPVKTQFGYHLIRVDERDPQREVAPDTLQSLKANAINRWLDAAKGEHRVERFIDSGKMEWAQRHAPKPRTA